jgi:fibro-slime domain-containing protein
MPEIFRKRMKNANNRKVKTLKLGVLTVVSACILAATVGTASAAITLTGTVLDQKMYGQGGTPDFQNFLGDDRGIVKTTLGGDGTPVYAGSPNTPTTSGAANFYNWFHSVSGVNQAIPYAITLDETFAGSGIYKYSNNSFFPIDNQGFGNQGEPHNFAFTYQIHTAFTYQSGQTFSFTGDDDVFVFINNQLVVDLGGVHPAETGAVNLDTLGLTVGNNYSFDIFFAERHTVASDFAMETSIELQSTVPEPSTYIAGIMLLMPFGVQGVRYLRNRKVVS